MDNSSAEYHSINKLVVMFWNETLYFQINKNTKKTIQFD